MKNSADVVGSAQLTCSSRIANRLIIINSVSVYKQLYAINNKVRLLQKHNVLEKHSSIGQFEQSTDKYIVQEMNSW